MLSIYTDGSCHPNPGPGSFGYVVVTNDKMLTSYVDYSDNTTNNRMEMTAIIYALKFLDKSTSAVIYSDSELCVKTYNEWIDSWFRRNWKNGKVANLDLVKELYEIKKQRPNVLIKWVKAHSFNHWNNYIDNLISPPYPVKSKVVVVKLRPKELKQNSLVTI
jgi:ribonuclease HI